MKVIEVGRVDIPRWRLLKFLGEYMSDEYQVLSWSDNWSVEDLEITEKPNQIILSGIINVGSILIKEAQLIGYIEIHPVQDDLEKPLDLWFISIWDGFERHWESMKYKLLRTHQTLDGFPTELPFELLSDKRKLMRETGITQSSNKDIFVPTRKADLERWRAVYRIIVDLREKYRDDALLGFGDSMTPSNDDIREALDTHGKKKHDNKTLKRIIKAGDAGLLK